MFVRRFLAAAALVGAFAALLSSPADAGVNVELRNGDQVVGQLSDPTEVEIFRVLLPEGAKLKVAVKGKKNKARGTAAPPMDFRVLDDLDATVLQGKQKGVGSKGKLTVEFTEVHRIEVFGDGVTAGDYQLKVSWKSPKKFKDKADLLGADDEFCVEFPASRGAAITAVAKPDKKSGAQPFFDRVEGDELDQGIGNPPTPGKPHKIKKFQLAEGGELFLIIRNIGGDGSVSVKVTIKDAKASRRKITLTDDEIGVGGEDGAKGGVITVPGGLIEVDEDDGDDDPAILPIVGAAVNVPPGALAQPTALVIATSPELPPQSTENGGVGPTVFFGPEGLEFLTPVTVTIPINLGQVADVNLLVVFTRNAEGDIEPIPGPFDVDVFAGTISFSVSHFSSFRAFAPKREPGFDLDGDGIDDLVVDARQANNGAGSVFVYLGHLSAGTTTVTTAQIRIDGAPGDEFGSSTAVGDLNGDGFADLVVNSLEDVNGTVHVFFGGLDFDPTTSSDADVTIGPGLDDDEIGQSLIVADLNNDGISDLIVGDEAANLVGRCYVFFGGTEFDPLDTDDADAVYEGEQADDLFGAGLAVGDIDNDGLPDLIVGADAIDRQGATGEVYIWLGRNGFTGGNAAQADVTISGAKVDGGFGLVIAAGDVNDDGIDDLIVSEGTDLFGTSRGDVYVFFGGTGFSDRGTAAADVQVTGSGPDDRLGSRIVLADVIGTPTLDVILSAPGHSQDLGGIFILEGGTGFGATAPSPGTVRIEGDGSDEGFGDVREAIGGRNRFVLPIFAPRHATGGTDAGRAYVFDQIPPTTESASAASFLRIDGNAGDQIGEDD